MIIIAFDTETTGIEPGSRFVQLAAVAFTLDWTTLGEFSRVANPGMPCPPEAAKIHGRTDDELRLAPSMAYVMETFSDWIDEVEEEHEGPVYLLAHNLAYDSSVLLWCSDFWGLEDRFSHLPAMCTLATSRALNVTKRHSLGFLAEHYQLEPREAHEALADALTCRDLFLRFVSMHGLPAMAPLGEWAEWRYAAVPQHCALPNLPDAVANGSPVQFEYVDAKGSLTNRTITPYGWGEKYGELRFHGLCHLRGEQRTFLMRNVVGGELPMQAASG